MFKYSLFNLNKILYFLVEEQQKALTVLPFFHIYGFNSIMNICLKEGMHLITLPKFTSDDYVKALIKYRPTYLFVVPSLLLFLASHPAVTKEHLASITSVTSGAAPATEGLLQKFRDKLGRRDVIIRQGKTYFFMIKSINSYLLCNLGYGMTESSPVTLFMPILIPPSKIGTVGVLYPSTQAKIISLSTGEVLGTHQSGELLVRGPQVCLYILYTHQVHNNIAK